MVSDYQRNDLGFGLAVGGALRPGLRVHDSIVLEGMLAGWLFPSDQGGGKGSLIGPGLRVEPVRFGGSVLFAGGHLGLGQTSSIARFAFDLNVGFDFRVSRRGALGPFVRYGQMVATSSDGGDDAKFLTVGLSLGWEPWIAGAAPLAQAAPAPPPPPAPKDSDRDGILDPDDRCPQEAQGATPDPKRPGCPFRDADGDKTSDDEDRCPTLAAGPNPDPERPGCPDGDDDGDGVPNHQDLCPKQPAGLNPDGSQRGCPLADSDHDNVPDLYDACRDKPGAPSADPKKNGCPGLVVIEAGAIRILRPVYFATNKDRILPRSAPVLKAVAAALKATPAIRKLAVQGHTDEQGTPDLNLDLSTRRAASVKRWLEENGIESDRLSSEGFGDTRPVASNKSRHGRAANRRVEFVIVDPPAAQSPGP